MAIREASRKCAWSHGRGRKPDTSLSRFPGLQPPAHPPQTSFLGTLPEIAPQQSIQRQVAALEADFVTFARIQ